MGRRAVGSSEVRLREDRSRVPDGVTLQPCVLGLSSVTRASVLSPSVADGSSAGRRDARSRLISSNAMVKNLRSRSGFAASVKCSSGIKAILSSMCEMSFAVKSAVRICGSAVNPSGNTVSLFSATIRVWRLIHVSTLGNDVKRFVETFNNLSVGKSIVSPSHNLVSELFDTLSSCR